MSIAGEIVIELKLDDKNMAVVVKNVGGLLRQMQGDMTRTAGAVKRMEERTDSLSTKFRHLVVTMGNLRFVAMDINDVFLRLPMSILKSAGELERMQVLMTGLSKETNKAAKAAEGLKDFNFVTGLAKKAPFDIAALADSFVKLKTAGIDPSNGSMNALVDSVARFGGTSESLKRASIAIQQMSGKGVISMEELRQQLGEAVPTAMQDMADGMGVSMAELAKIVQTGTLKTGPAINKMLLMMQINNSGAAAEMMKTWTGMLSRLKSEWELTAKFIADSGFGNASKDAVAKLIDVMRTDDFKRFSSDSGAALGKFMGSLVSFTQTLVKYRSEILFLGQAWIAYKVAFALIGPAGNAIGAGIKDRIAWMKLEGTTAQRNLLLDRAAIVQKAEMTAADQARSVAVIRSYEMEVNAARMKSAYLLASEAQLTAAVAARSARGALLWPNMAANAVDKASIAQINAASTALMVRQRELGASIARTTATLNVQTAAAVQAQMAMTNLTRVTTFGVAASAAASIGMKALTGAMALLGGPVGLAIIVIMGLAWAWNRSAAAAEESVDRQRRAASRLSTIGDAAEDASIKKDAEYALKAAQLAKKRSDDQLVPDGFGKARKKTAEEMNVAPQTAAVQRAQEALNKATNVAAVSGNIVREALLKQRTEDINTQVGHVISKSEDATNDEIANIRNDGFKRLAALKAGSKEHSAENFRINKLRMDAQDKGFAMRIAGHTAAADKLEALEEKDAGLRASNLRAANVEREAVEALKQQMLANRATRATPDEYKDKGEKGAGKGSVSPIQKWANSLVEDKAALDVAISGVMSSIGKVDPVEVALAAARAKLATDAFNVPVKDKDGKKIGTAAPSEKEKAAILEMVGQVARLESLKDDITKVSEDIINGSEDYKRAMLFLSNPLAGEDGAKTNKNKELIAKLQNDKTSLLALAKGANLLPDELIAKFEQGARQAAGIDLAATFKPVIDSMIALGPEYKHALQVMANPFGGEDFKESNQFDKVLAKMKKTPEELRAIAIETGIGIEVIEGMLAKVKQGSAQAATVDFSKSYRELADQNRAMNISLIQDDRVRAQTQIDLDNSVFEAKAALRIREANERGVNAALIAKMEIEYAEARKLRAEKNRLDMQTPIEKMADDFQQSMKKMEDASARWGNGFVDMLVSSSETGKLQFGSFVKSIMTDLLKIQLQKTLGDPLKDIISKGTSWLQSAVPSFATNARDAGVESAASGPVAEAAMVAARGLFKTQEAADLAKQGLVSMTESGTKAATEAMVAGLSVQAQDALASATFTGSITAATAAVYAFTAAMQASGAGGGAGGLAGLFGGSEGFLNDMGGAELPMSLGFADGGIMTSMGSMPLRKYAAGGIANSPQMAIFGEGSHNEAYVPLPDGRSIPVTMSGGQAGSNVVSNNVSITINVAKDGSGGDKASSEGDAQGWRKMAEKVRSVVREEMVNNQRPGGLLYK